MKQNSLSKQYAKELLTYIICSIIAAMSTITITLYNLSFILVVITKNKTNMDIIATNFIKLFYSYITISAGITGIILTPYITLLILTYIKAMLTYKEYKKTFYNIINILTIVLFTTLAVETIFTITSYLILSIIEDKTIKQGLEIIISAEMYTQLYKKIIGTIIITTTTISIITISIKEEITNIKTILKRLPALIIIITTTAIITPTDPTSIIIVTTSTNIIYEIFIIHTILIKSKLQNS